MKKIILLVGLILANLLPINSLKANLQGELSQLHNMLAALAIKLAPSQTTDKEQIIINTWLEEAQGLKQTENPAQTSERLLKEIIKKNEDLTQAPLFAKQTVNKDNINLILDYIQDAFPKISDLISYADLLIQKNTNNFGNGYRSKADLAIVKRNAENAFNEKIGRRKRPASQGPRPQQPNEDPMETIQRLALERQQRVSEGAAATTTPTSQTSTTPGFPKPTLRRVQSERFEKQTEQKTPEQLELEEKLARRRGNK